MAVGAAALLLVALLATPVAAKGGDTRATFESFAAGTASDGPFPDGRYANIKGAAWLIRSNDDTTVTVKVNGLVPGERYGSHVHNAGCKDNFAGGHYQFPADLGVVMGAVLFGGGYEIWPGPFTADENGAATARTTVGARAGDDAVSVVIHAPMQPDETTPKIACAEFD